MKSRWSDARSIGIDGPGFPAPIRLGPIIGWGWAAVRRVELAITSDTLSPRFRRGVGLSERRRDLRYASGVVTTPGRDSGEPTGRAQKNAAPTWVAHVFTADVYIE